MIACGQKFVEAYLPACRRDWNIDETKICDKASVQIWIGSVGFDGGTEWSASDPGCFQQYFKVWKFSYMEHFLEVGQLVFREEKVPHSFRGFRTCSLDE
jgi:hypothetical protein